MVIGVTVNGERDILGIWAGDGSLRSGSNPRKLLARRMTGAAEAALRISDLPGRAGVEGGFDAFNPRQGGVESVEEVGRDRCRPFGDANGPT